MKNYPVSSFVFLAASLTVAATSYAQSEGELPAVTVREKVSKDALFSKEFNFGSLAALSVKFRVEILKDGSILLARVFPDVKILGRELLEAAEFASLTACAKELRKKSIVFTPEAQPNCHDENPLYYLANAGKKRVAQSRCGAFQKIETIENPQCVAYAVADLDLFEQKVMSEVLNSPAPGPLFQDGF